MASTFQISSPVELVKAFIACVKTKDCDRMRTLSHPEAIACLTRENGPRFQTLESAIQRREKNEHEFEEVLWDEVEHLDGDYATVWMKFSITRDGKPHQSGSSTFSCWNSPSSGWIILTMTDIARSAE